MFFDLNQPKRQEPSVLTCPCCGYDYTHVREVYTRLADDVESAVIRGTRAKGRLMPKWRRSALAILVEGECGHKWELRLQQHKGQTYIEVNIDLSDKEAADDAEFLTTLGISPE